MSFLGSGVGSGNFHPKTTKDEARETLLMNGFTKDELKGLNGRELITLLSQLRIFYQAGGTENLLSKFKKVYLKI